MNIYIVDDDEEDVEFLSDGLARFDDSIRAVSFENGDLAFKQLQKDIYLPEFIFLDINMPLMNGLEFLGAVQKFPRIAGIPIVVYSTNPDELESDKLSSAYAIVRKPEKFSELLTLLENLLR